MKIYVFGQISPNDDLYSCFDGILSFNTKKYLKKNYQAYRLLIITLSINQKKTFLISELSNEYNL